MARLLSPFSPEREREGEMLFILYGGARESQLSVCMLAAVQDSLGNLDG